MSNMLEQAIIDADSLKEAARQSAEEKIVEHFSKDIKEAVNMILEQEVAPGDLSTMAATSPYCNGNSRRALNGRHRGR